MSENTDGQNFRAQFPRIDALLADIEKKQRGYHLAPGSSGLPRSVSRSSPPALHL